MAEVGAVFLCAQLGLPTDPRAGYQCFGWHKHDEADDFFLVLKVISPSKFEIAASSTGPVGYSWFPKVKHRPVAKKEVPPTTHRTRRNAKFAATSPLPPHTRRSNDPRRSNARP